MVLSIAHLQPIVSLIAGVLILIVPRLLGYIVAFFLIVSGLLVWGSFTDKSSAKSCGAGGKRNRRRIRLAETQSAARRRIPPNHSADEAASCRYR
jgi:hypothetical protein